MRRCSCYGHTDIHNTKTNLSSVVPAAAPSTLLARMHTHQPGQQAEMRRDPKQASEPNEAEAMEAWKEDRDRLKKTKNHLTPVTLLHAGRAWAQRQSMVERIGL